MANKLFSELLRGTYDNGTEYTIGDIVNYNGSSYACRANTIGNLPTDTDYWALLASKGDTGANGTDGTDGTDGANAYVYIAYASDSNGTGFTTTFNASLNYIAIKKTTTEIAVPQASDFTGLWFNYKGDTGDTGPAGADAYVYVAYASDDSGTDFTLTFNPALDYIAIKNSTTEISTPQASDFAGLWKNYKGATGETGATGATGADGADGVVQTVVAGTGISVNSTDPANPIVTNTLDISGKEDASNKSTTMSGNTASDTKYLSAKAIYDWATGLFALLAGSITQAFQVSQLEVGHATDTTITRTGAGAIALEGIEIPTISSTSTFTNKRTNPRLVTAASYTTDTGTSLSVATCDQFEVTAQAGDLKFNNPGGTPLGGNKLIIRIKDDGTARALTYDTQFRAMGTALPSTTVPSKTLYMGFIYNATDTKWDLVAVAQEA